MKTTIVLPFLSLLIAVTSVSKAQEVQVPLDREGKIEVIDSGLEKKLGLFTMYQDFREARLYQISDSSYVLEITYQLAERTIKTRLPQSASQVADLREKVSQRITVQAPETRLNHEGRAWMLVGSAALSLGYYGWAVPVALQVEDGKTTVALYMLTSGAGFFVPLALTNNIDVTDAHAILYVYGGTRGILHGVFLNNLLFGGEATARGGIAMGMVGSLVESIAGFSIASKTTAGTASTMGVCGDIGLGLALGTSGLLDFYDSGQERALAATILVGSGVGLVAGHLLAKDQPYTRGDAFVLEGTSLLGAYVPLAMLDLFNVKSGKTYTAVSMAGAVTGLYLAHGYLLRGKDFTTGQGIMIQLGTLGGGLIGAGIAYLLSSDRGDGTLLLTSSAIGAVGGFALTYGQFSGQAQAKESSSSWRLNLNPAGLLASKFMKDPSGSIARLPFLNLEYRF
jgi:hypothetical protein